MDHIDLRAELRNVRLPPARRSPKSRRAPTDSNPWSGKNIPRGEPLIKLICCVRSGHFFEKPMEQIRRTCNDPSAKKKSRTCLCPMKNPMCPIVCVQRKMPAVARNPKTRPNSQKKGLLARPHLNWALRHKSSQVLLHLPADLSPQKILS